MAEQAYAYVTLIPVAKGFQRAVASELSGLDNKGSGAGSQVGKKFQSGFAGALKGLAAPVAAAFSGVAAFNFVKGAVGQASNLAESINAVNVSFGSAAAGIQKLGADAATSLGLSTQQFNQLAVGFTAFAEKISGPGGDVVGVIDQLTTRGADFASVMNLEVNDALTIFRSGLAGETEPLRRFGIDLSENAVKAFAYANNIAAAGTELTEQQKIQARYGALLEQTNRFAGDFANTSDGLANSQRILKATFADVQAEVGGALLPVLAELSTALIPVVKDLAPVLTTTFQALAPVIQVLAENISPLLDALAPLIETFGTLATVAADILGQILPPLIDVIAAVAPIIRDVVEAVLPLVTLALPPLVDLINNLLPILTGWWDILATLLVPVIEVLATVLGVTLAVAFQAINAVVEAAIDFFRPFFEAMKPGIIDAVSTAIKGLTDFLGPLLAQLKPVVDALLSFAGIKESDLRKTVTIDYKVDPGVTGENNRFNNLAKSIAPKIEAPKLPQTPQAPKSTEAADAAKKAREQAIKERAALKKVIKDAREDFIETRQAYQDEVNKINDDFEKRRDAIGKSYDQDVTRANKRFAEQTAQIAKRYNEAVTSATERRDSSLANALAEHNRNIAKIQDDFAKRQADLITQSMNRLRDAYKGAVQVNVASIFDSNEIAGSIEGTVETLREKLVASRRLLANAAALTAAGFSQTFVEQVVGAGTDVGNELADAILGATPETKAELKALYNSLESESETGMNQLAQQITDQAGLATAELRNLYSANQVALAEALAAENLAYKDAIAGIQVEFSKAIADAERERTDALAEAQADLDDALLEAKIKRDDALAEAEKDFQDALLTAADNYAKDLAKIETQFKEKVKSMKGAAAGLAAEIRGLNSALSQAQAKVKPSGGSATPMTAMATGGLVTGPLNALIGEAGPEVVIPLDRFESMMGMSSQGPALNYYAAPNQSMDSERDLFQAMKRAKVVVGW